jgi:hypothetical protein
MTVLEGRDYRLVMKVDHASRVAGKFPNFSAGSNRHEAAIPDGDRFRSREMSIDGDDFSI